jgi:hypothetical protein
MSLFGNLKTEGLSETEDRLGGFQPWETDIYSGKIKMAYAGQSAGGAQNITVILDLNNKEYRETIYITNKKGENFFLNKEDKSKKVPLPGFTIIDDMCLVATGKPLAEQGVEEKMVKVYDMEARKELPKSVNVLTELLGKEVSVSILKTLENKNEKNSSGEYVPTADTRTVNNIDKVFDTESKMTVAEARNGVETASFWDAWVDRNKGVTRDKRTIKDGATGGQPGRPNVRPMLAPVAGAAAAPRKSLFANRA